jgi:acetyltransferase-like isoleucine patch superfamily enzyme
MVVSSFVRHHTLLHVVRAVFLLVGLIYRKGVGAIARLRSWALFQEIGPGSRCPLSVTLKFPENIRVGRQVAIGPESTLGAKAEIILEDYVRISKGVTLETGGLDLSKPLPYPHVASPIHIKRGAWLGAGCMILSGVTIGENAVIGAGVVVARDVAPGDIIVAARTRRIGSVDEK